MKILWQIGIFLSICFAGECISQLLPFAFPANIISMIILSILLFTKLIKPRHLNETSDFLTKTMAFLFIPSGVGVMQVVGSIKNSLLPLIAVCIISTIVTFAVTAFTVSGVIRLQEWVKTRRRERS